VFLPSAQYEVIGGFCLGLGPQGIRAGRKIFPGLQEANTIRKFLFLRSTGPELLWEDSHTFPAPKLPPWSVVCPTESSRSRRAPPILFLHAEEYFLMIQFLTFCFP